MSTIMERVARGAEWLDAKYPGWHDKIDLSILDMSSCNMCVLGQVYTGVIPAPERGQVLAQVLANVGRFNDLGTDDIDVWRSEYQENVDDGTFGGYNVIVDFHELEDGGEHHGFVTTMPGVDVADDELQAVIDVEYEQLLDEWTRVIISRRMAHAGVLVAA